MQEKITTIKKDNMPLSYFEGHDFTRDNPKRAVKQDMSKGQFVDGTDKTNDKTDKKIEEKIKELLDMLFIEETKYKVNVAQSSTVSNTVPDIRSSPEYSAVNIVGKEAITKLLSTLIQAERKDAIRWFVDNIGWKKPSEVIDLADDVIDGRSLVKQMEAYLQSSDKGDKITSNTLTITEEELENASYTSSTIESEGK